MSILDNAVMLGVESTYGTPVALSRAYEAKGDDMKDAPDYLESVGFRAGLQTVRSDRRTRINMGGAGSWELDVMDKGLGLLMQGLLGAVSGPTQVAATTAYEQTHTSTADGPSTSYTTQYLRSRVGTDAVQPFTYHGSVPTGWRLSQGNDGLLTLEVDWDFEDEDTSTGAGTPTYVAAQTPFNWSNAVVTYNSAALDCKDFDFAADLMMKTDRRYLRGSSLKKQPERTGVPEYSGSFTADFEDTTEFALFKAGTIAPLSVLWSGATDAIESGHTFEFQVTCPEVQLIGETPEMSLTELTNQPLPFKVLDDGSNPSVSVRIKSTDTAL